jgi:adenosine deaminase
MRMSDLAPFIRGLPKAELHLHIEGSLEPEQMFAFGKRNKVDLPFKSVEEVRAAYAFSNLQDFLDIYYQGANVLQTEEDFKDMALAYFARLHADGGRHAEIFFDPETHTDRGLPFSIAINGLTAGMKEAEVKYGITSSCASCGIWTRRLRSRR